MKKGIFYGVGIGPGEAELMTLKAVRILEGCEVIATPQTKSGETLALDIVKDVIDFSGKTVLPLFFSMERDKELLQKAHLAAAWQVEAYLAQGQDVAMLNLGDVSIYATYSYLMEMLRARGYQTEMIPGVPSFCAVAAKLGISLTTMHTTLHIAPGSKQLDRILELDGTKILMKSGKQLPNVLQALRERGQLQNSMLVANCGLVGEQVYENLAEQTPEGLDASYFTTIIVKE